MTSKIIFLTFLFTLFLLFISFLFALFFLLFLNIFIFSTLSRWTRTRRHYSFIYILFKLLETSSFYTHFLILFGTFFLSAQNSISILLNFIGLDSRRFFANILSLTPPSYTTVYLSDFSL